MTYFNSCARTLLALILATSSSSLLAESKIGCKEAEATQVKCAEFEAQSKACSDMVQIEGKKKIDEAKKAQSECKAKNGGAMYLMKCKTEEKKATTLANTPKMVLNSSVEKELVAVADSPCARADAIGKEKMICKGPKKVLELMKANCIKDM